MSENEKGLVGARKAQGLSKDDVGRSAPTPQSCAVPTLF